MEEPEVTPIETDVEITEVPPQPGDDDKTSPPDEGGEPEEELSADELKEQLDTERKQRQKAESRQAYWEREAKRQQRDRDTKPTQPGGDELIDQTRPKPVSSQFDDYDQYLDALTDWKMEQREAKAKAAQSKSEAQERSAKFQKNLMEGTEKYEDFDEIARNPDLPITQDMVNALFDCDHAADIAYYLGQNIQETRRIALLSPIAVAREIGKLEARFVGPPPKTKTNAPEATKPIGSHEKPPKSWEKMTASDADDFIADRNRAELGGD